MVIPLNSDERWRETGGNPRRRRAASSRASRACVPPLSISLHIVSPAVQPSRKGPHLLPPSPTNVSERPESHTPGLCLEGGPAGSACGDCTFRRFSGEHFRYRQKFERRLFQKTKDRSMRTLQNEFHPFANCRLARNGYHLQAHVLKQHNPLICDSHIAKDRAQARLVM
jgi:hypothetical protein